MDILCKFRVASVTNAEHGCSVTMHPVVSGSKENEEFYKYTPGGSLLLSTINEQAAKQFSLGQEFYLRLTPAHLEETVS